MCTVTVHRLVDKQAVKPNTLIVTMNRDERRDRGVEIAPQVHTNSHTIYPLDSEADGTWFGVNQFSLCLSLLNRYDKIDYSATRSRGLLIPELLQHSNVQAAKLALIDMNLTDFAPFTLMMNTFESCEIIQWTGQDFILEHPIVTEYMHLSSSSWQADDVLPWRKRAFENWVDQGAQYDARGLPLYNLHQPEGKAEYAPLVSRDNAMTKSITQYHCQPGQIMAQYCSESDLPDGQPVTVTMPLHTA